MYKKLLIIINLLFMIMLASCGEKIEKVAISVNNDDVNISYDAIIGKKVVITPYYKQGFYMTGFYSQEEGGYKYFDSMGNSLSEWKKENPTNFYSQWEILTKLKFNGSYLDEPEGLSYSLWINLPPEFKNAVDGNLDANVHIDVTFKSMFKQHNLFPSSSSYMWLNIGGIKQGVNLTLNYISYDLDYDIQANKLMNSNGTLILSFEGSNDFQSQYVKNIMIELKFSD